MKKIIAIIIVIVLLVGAGVLVFFKMNDQIKILDREADKIATMDIEKDKIDMNIYSTGDYMAVEDVMKHYVSDYLDELEVFKALLNDEYIGTVLSIENIQATAPEFLESIGYLEGTKVLLESSKDTLIKMGKEKSIMNAIEGESVSDHQKDIYRKEMVDNIGLSFFYPEEEIEKAAEVMNTKIDAILNTLNFLTVNAGKWSINENVLQFENEELLAQYQELIAAIG